MHIDLKIQLVLAHKCQFGYSKQFGESQQSGKFLHSYGTHNSSSNSGKLTEKNELVEFNNVGELEEAVIKKYGKKKSNTDYFGVIKMIKSLE